MHSFPQPISRLLSFWCKKKKKENDDNVGEKEDSQENILVCNQSARVASKMGLFFLSNLIFPNVGGAMKNLWTYFTLKQYIYVYVLLKYFPLAAWISMCCQLLKDGVWSATLLQIKNNIKQNIYTTYTRSNRLTMLIWVRIIHGNPKERNSSRTHTWRRVWTTDENEDMMNGHAVLSSL